MIVEKTSFVELSKKNQRPIVIFGSGNLAKKTINKLGKEKVAFIVDNSKDLQGQQYESFDVKLPSDIGSDHFVIICSTAISEISKQLISIGLEPNQDFTISPLLNDLLAISELEQLKTNFFFTSGTISEKDNPNGGGLYQCSVNGEDVQVTKVYSGPCYGAIRQNDDIIFIDTDNGIFKYSNELIHLGNLPKGARAHGISYNKKHQRYYVTCSDIDAILELDEEFKPLRTFEISDKINRSNEPMHHCNDNLSMGDSLYVSMFSSTGNWKNDVFDGCIAEFDIETGKRLHDVSSNLNMPHSVNFFEGSLHVLDSLPGHLRFENLSIKGTFPAFTRGLQYHNGLYYIGQSKNRNYSKVIGLSNNISIDCGVIIFNPVLKVSRFIQFPMTIGEIHSIVI